MSGLYGGLPSARDASEEAAKTEKKEGWAGSGLFAPAALAAKRAGEGSRKAQGVLDKGLARVQREFTLARDVDCNLSPSAAALAPPAALRPGGGRGRGREGPPPVAPGRGGSAGRGQNGAADKARDGGSVLLAAASSNDGPITVTATAVPAVMPGMSLGEDIK